MDRQKHPGLVPGPVYAMVYGAGKVDCGSGAAPYYPGDHAASLRRVVRPLGGEPLKMEPQAMPAAIIDLGFYQSQPCREKILAAAFQLYARRASGLVALSG